MNPYRNILNRERRLGHAIRCMRESRNISSDWMAAKMGYSDRSGYCKLERGEIRDISVWKLVELCDLLDCHLAELLQLAGIEVFLHPSRQIG